MLSLRQHEYPMYGPLERKALEPFVLHDLGGNNLVMRKVRKVWTIITRVRNGEEGTLLLRNPMSNG